MVYSELNPFPALSSVWLSLLLSGYILGKYMLDEPLARENQNHRIAYPKTPARAKALQGLGYGSHWFLHQSIAKGHLYLCLEIPLSGGSQRQNIDDWQG